MLTVTEPPAHEVHEEAKPLTLEEVFTYEMETLGYTFQIDDLLEEESEHAKS